MKYTTISLRAFQETHLTVATIRCNCQRWWTKRTELLRWTDYITFTMLISIENIKENRFDWINCLSDFSAKQWNGISNVSTWIEHHLECLHFISIQFCIGLHLLKCKNFRDWKNWRNQLLYRIFITLDVESTINCFIFYWIVLLFE